MSTDALFQLGIVPVVLNTTQTEDHSLVHATGPRIARAARVSPLHAISHRPALPGPSSYPPTRRP
jgi:hypothetical protein